MKVKTSDLAGRYPIMLNEIRKVIATLIEQGGSTPELVSARSDMADLLVNYHLLLLKHQGAVDKFTEEGIDSTVQLNELEATLVISIIDIYTETASTARAAAAI